MMKLKLFRRQERQTWKIQKIVSLNVSHFLTGAYYSHIM